LVPYIVPQSVPTEAVQGPQQQAIHDAKHYGVGADRQGQGHHGGEGETGGLAQNADSEAYILHQRLEEMAAHGLVAFLFESFPAPNSMRACRSAWVAIKAATFQIVCTILDVGAKLFFHTSATSER